MAPTKHQHHSQFAPEFEAFLRDQEASGANPLASLPLPEVRRAIEDAEVTIWSRGSDKIVSRDLTIPSSVASTIPLRIHELKSSKGRRKRLVFMIHGGGWSMGGVYSDSFATSAFVTRMDMAVVTIGYSLAPEDPFPRAFHDCCEALTWILNEPDMAVFSREKIVIAGFSAGGNLAAAVTHWAYSHGFADRLAAQVLFSPATCHYKQLYNASQDGEIELDSISNASSPFLTGQQLKHFWDNYYPEGEADPRVSPLLSQNLSGPPTYIQVCGADPLRDEGIAYAEKLRKAGVQVGLDIYSGMPHAYHSDLIAIPGRERTIDDLVSWLRQNTDLES